MALQVDARMLHWVFKVANRTDTMKFYEKVLGMKVLRHEEFSEGCAASCNGPYDGKWSKSMVGFGDESTHFVVELTYNYGIKYYELGNDFGFIKIRSSKAIEAAKQQEYEGESDGNGGLFVKAPGGYTFYLVPGEATGDPVEEICFYVADLQRSMDYWHGLLGMASVEATSETALLRYSADTEGTKCALRLKLLPGGVELNHAGASGRIAFSCPADQLPGVEKSIKEKGHTIVTPLVSLDTPGKATVQVRIGSRLLPAASVVILADPDGYEICFVGDEAFRELSQIDPEGPNLVAEAIAADGSDAYFEKKAQKAAARAAAAAAGSTG
eukprot:scaffold2357_cov399-Prasinococcus_capsulatus_cf.AAC.8